MATDPIHSVTQKAETINGRLAMVAFALTIAVETFRVRFPCQGVASVKTSEDGL